MLLAEIDTDKRERRKHGPERFNEERGRRREKGEREREGLRYTLQVRARVSRAANEPAAARFWLHGLRY